MSVVLVFRPKRETNSLNTEFSCRIEVLFSVIDKNNSIRRSQGCFQELCIYILRRFALV